MQQLSASQPFQLEFADQQQVWTQNQASRLTAARFLLFLSSQQAPWDFTSSLLHGISVQSRCDWVCLPRLGVGHSIPQGTVLRVRPCRLRSWHLVAGLGYTAQTSLVTTRAGLLSDQNFLSLSLPSRLSYPPTLDGNSRKAVARCRYLSIAFLSLQSIPGFCFPLKVTWSVVFCYSRTKRM